MEEEKKKSSRGKLQCRCCLFVMLIAAAALAIQVWRAGTSGAPDLPTTVKGPLILTVLSWFSGDEQAEKDREINEARERLRVKNGEPDNRGVPFSQIPISPSSEPTTTPPAPPERTVAESMARDRRAELDARAATDPDFLRLEADWRCDGRVRASVLVDDACGLWIVALLPGPGQPPVAVALGEGRALLASKEGVTCIVGNGEELTFDVKNDLEAASRAAGGAEGALAVEVLVYQDAQVLPVARSGVPLPELLATLRGAVSGELDLAALIARVRGQQ